MNKPRRYRESAGKRAWHQVNHEGEGFMKAKEEQGGGTSLFIAR